MTTKVCAKCRIEKEIVEFGRFFSKERNKMRIQSNCFQCLNLLAKKRRDENKNNPAHKARVKVWNRRAFVKAYKDPVFRAKRKAIYDKWRKANPEKAKLQRAKAHIKFYATHREEMKERVRQWELLNPQRVKLNKSNWENRNREKYYANVKKKNDRRHSAEKVGNITTDYLLWLEKEIGEVCPYCKMGMTIKHLDHIVPLSKNGKHEIGNVLYCCATCNLRKANKTLEEYNGMKFEDLPITLLTTSK